jgi:hypothetical protein
MTTTPAGGLTPHAPVSSAGAVITGWTSRRRQGRG